MGSSAISPIIKGITGPTGPTGPTGAIGPSGVGTGLTGNPGVTGVYISGVLVDELNTALVKSDGSFNFVVTGTRGPTGYTGTMYGENQGSGLSLYSSLSGFTLSVKGLTFTGNLSAEVTFGTLLITPSDVFYGVTLANGIANDRVLYSKSSSIIDSSRIQLGKTYSDFYFTKSAGITAGSLPVYSEMAGNVIEIASGQNDLILGLTLGSVYVINTPLGLSGFTLDNSLYGNNELISFTFFIEGNGFTQFPSNVFFEDSPYSSVFGCGTNIMNLMTYDKGQNWFATIADRGYGVTGCSGEEAIGSCCYIGISGDRECVEYITKASCDAKLNSTFSLLTACDPLCRETAICCSNGTCVEGVSKEECEYFLGKYYAGISCSPYVQTGNNSERLCYSTDEPAYSCCTGGTCIDQVTATICLNYYKGNPVTGGCCDISCETLSVIEGACCMEGQTPSCATKTPTACAASGGIFYGNATECADVNCCFDVRILGYCCIGAICNANFTEVDCLNTSGASLWRSTLDACEAACSAGGGLGSCCIFGTCQSDTSESDCTDIVGEPGFWYDSPNCNGECS